MTAWTTRIATAGAWCPGTAWTSTPSPGLRSLRYQCQSFRVPVQELVLERRGWALRTDYRLLVLPSHSCVAASNFQVVRSRAPPVQAPSTTTAETPELALRFRVERGLGMLVCSSEASAAADSHGWHCRRRLRRHFWVQWTLEAREGLG